MKSLLIAALLLISVNVGATIYEAPVYNSNIRAYGGYGMLSYGSNYGAMFNDTDATGAWCLGYSPRIDLTGPTCVLKWTTSGVTLTGTLSNTGAQTITGALTVSGAISGTTITGSGAISGTTITGSGAIAGTTINTGQGANEVYDMDQNLMTTDSPTFEYVTIAHGVSAVSGTYSGTVTSNDVTVVSNVASGGYIQFHPISTAEVTNMTPTVKGQQYFWSDGAPARPIWSVIGGWIDATGVSIP